jgi:NAD(P)H-dependent FMN reductase
VSRVRHSGSIAYRNRVYLIGGTSDGADGGVRAVLDLRKVLAAVGGIVLPGEIAIPRAQYAFDESGALVDEAAAAALGDLARQLIEFAGRLAD